jgi:hypothetical protein
MLAMEVGTGNLTRESRRRFGSVSMLRSYMHAMHRLIILLRHAITTVANGHAAHFIFSRGRLKPPLRFMYCLHVLCLWTLTAPSALTPMPFP